MPRRKGGGNDRQTLEQFAQLRELTSKYGTIHEAQALQLRVWPRVIVQGVTYSETRLDVEKREALVAMRFHGKQKKPSAATKKALSRLCESVQWLLGDDWEVSCWRLVPGGSKRDAEEQLLSLDRKAEPKGSKFLGTDFAAGRQETLPWQFQRPKKG